MILAFDIGNTHICPIFFSEDGKILEKFRIPSKTHLTEDVLYSFLKTLSDNKNIDLTLVKDIIICSVVPHLDEIFIYLSKKYFNKVPYILNYETTTNLVHVDDSSERKLGSDRIAAIIAAQKIVKNRHCIVIDFGTAITFEMIYNKEYLGGAILPGIELSINALFQNTAKLPKIIFKKADNVLANTTVDQINLGIYYANIGAIKELITQYKKVFSDSFVISTGGQGKEISKELQGFIDEYIPNLVENGIFEFYNLNKK